MTDLALYVHEDEPSREADGHDHQLGPERPFEVAHLDLVGGVVDEDIERPDDARDGHDVERDGAEQLAALDRAHVQLLPLTKRLHLKQRDSFFKFF